jgi:hypothetical protein
MGDVEYRSPVLHVEAVEAVLQAAPTVAAATVEMDTISPAAPALAVAVEEVESIMLVA